MYKNKSRIFSVPAFVDFKKAAGVMPAALLLVDVMV